MTVDECQKIAVALAQLPCVKISGERNVPIMRALRIIASYVEDATVEITELDQGFRIDYTRDKTP